MINGTRSNQKLLVFPRGKFFVEKYEDWITFDDIFFNEIIDAYNCDVLKKPFVDKNHDLQESYGDLSNPVVEKDGLFFDCILNDAGVELVQNRAYTSISPTFGKLTDTNGKVWNNCLISVTLTNIPALQNNYPELQTQFSLSMSGDFLTFNFGKKEERKMKNLEMILKKLELNPEASDAAIAEAIQKLIDSGATAEDLIAAKDSMIESLNKKIEELTASAEGAMAEVADMKADLEKKEFENDFIEALKGGVILPAEKDHYEKLWKFDREFARTQMKKLTIKKEGKPITTQYNLTDEDRAVMKMARLNPDNHDDVDFFKKLHKIGE